MNKLRNYKKNITSQFGEDGIIKEIFNRVGMENPLCVEFGAWDGKKYSNTWNLWHENDWSAILIESDASKIALLKKEISNFPKAIAVEALVKDKGENSLDNILDKLKINKKIDLISIDIDGDDYYILKSLKKHSPRVIVIEYNPTIPPELDIVQKKGEYFGASAKALCALAREKGYKLATITDTNCIFIENQEFSKLEIEEPLLKDIFIRNHISSIITSYDGKTFIDKMSPYTSLETTKYNKILPQYISEQELIPIYLKRNIPILTILYRTIKLNLKLFIKENFLFKIIKKKINYFIVKKKVLNNYIIHKKKEKVIINYKKKYNIQILLETGTYRGEMVAAMLNYFKYIYSIELSTPLFKKANEIFKKNKNVRLYQGDSGEVISQILKKINEPCIFWLDGHYSAGDTAKGDLNTPIIKELAHIINHPIKNHVILIDDARCFNGTDDYPEISEIKMFIEKNAPHYKTKILNDIFRITV